ncbi:hypothetical protein [Nannocystis pusilla]|uniref:hypothetical protein n=1 Tax=Nannocystis pusilla TaxID=889268 RepID=UPI003DA3B3AF
MKNHSNVAGAPTGISTPLTLSSSLVTLSLKDAIAWALPASFSMSGSISKWRISGGWFSGSPVVMLHGSPEPGVAGSGSWVVAGMSLVALVSTPVLLAQDDAPLLSLSLGNSAVAWPSTCV